MLVWVANLPHLIRTDILTKINMASDPLGDSCPNLFDEEDDLFKPSTEWCPCAIARSTQYDLHS
ncbi:hypothetical protein T05_12202 [Trichinella murrelli]|uniref:Uncharacterized protein n=1 Tax=Trichinella murrelli TaxID=144512 RepID=A0A0V0TMX7_9BILA|nr:hypothetical protein T05_12202 [Trichinella murrelli]